MSPFTTTMATLVLVTALVLAAALTTWWMADRRVRALQLAHICAVQEAQAEGATPPPLPAAVGHARARLGLAHGAALLTAAVTAAAALVFGVSLVAGI